MSKYEVLILVVIVVLVTSILGGQWGYTVDGIPSSPDSGTNILFDTIGFFWDMITFGVEGLPAWINAVFILINLLMVYLLYNALRGNG